MSRQIVVSVDGFPEAGLRRMEKTAGASGATIRFLPEKDGWCSAPPGLEAAFGLPPIDFVEHGGLRFLQLHSAGYDTYRTPALLQKRDFTVANARGVTAQAVAEHCLSMVFAFSRRTLFHAENQRQGLWQRAPRYELLHDSNITIVGTGAIGGALGTMCKGIGMRVLAVQRKTHKPSYAEDVYPFSELHTALRASRHLALALPALPGEKPLIGATELSCLPRGSYVYNIGRASALDYSAVLSALDDGILAGAGLDVFPTEPLPAMNAFWRRRDVIVSPHAGGRFVGEMEALADLFVDNLQRYLSGAPLRNVVIGPYTGD